MALAGPPRAVTVGFWDGILMGDVFDGAAYARVRVDVPLNGGSVAIGGTVGSGPAVGKPIVAFGGGTGSPCFKMCGVTTMTSSFRVRCVLLLRNMPPTRGN